MEPPHLKKRNPTMISRCSLHPQWDQFQDIKTPKSALLVPRPSKITTQVVQSTGTPTFVTFIYFYNSLLI